MSDDLLTELKRELSTRLVLNQIAKERKKQDRKWGEQNHPIRPEFDQASLSAIATNSRHWCDQRRAEGTMTWRDILLEEVHEVFAESDPARQREELVQVAAVAVAMIEMIDRQELLNREG